jgi:hypothetical protein
MKQCGEYQTLVIITLRKPGHLVCGQLSRPQMSTLAAFRGSSSRYWGTHVELSWWCIPSACSHPIDSGISLSGYLSIWLGYPRKTLSLVMVAACSVVCDRRTEFEIMYSLVIIRREQEEDKRPLHTAPVLEGRASRRCTTVEREIGRPTAATSG